MAKYTATIKNIYGGRISTSVSSNNPPKESGNFTNYVYDSGSTRFGNRVDSKRCYATSFFLTSTTELEKIRRYINERGLNNTISSIILTITSAYGPNQSGYLAYGSKTNTATTADNSWQVTSLYTTSIAKITSSSDEITNTFDITKAGLPSTNAYVVGSYDYYSGMGYCNIKSYSIVFDYNEATFTLKYDNTNIITPLEQQTALNVTYHDFTISSITPARAGYVFKGWATSSTATTPQYQPGGTIRVTGTTTLYAVWEPLPGKLYFDAQGGSECTPIDILIDEPYGTLPTPTYLGHVFLGWSPYPAREHLFIDSSTIVSKTGNFLVFAQWARDSEIFIDIRELKE